MKTYESEKFTYVDKATGATVTRLTGAYSNSNHLYFTNNCFYDEGQNSVDLLFLALLQKLWETNLRQPPY